MVILIRARFRWEISPGPASLPATDPPPPESTVDWPRIDMRYVRYPVGAEYWDARPYVLRTYPLWQNEAEMSPRLLRLFAQKGSTY